MVNQRAGILGTGHSYPEGILTNEDLAKIVETSDEWITTRTGIKERRVSHVPMTTLSHVASLRAFSVTSRWRVAASLRIARRSSCALARASSSCDW